MGGQVVTGSDVCSVQVMIDSDHDRFRSLCARSLVSDSRCVLSVARKVYREAGEKRDRTSQGSNVIILNAHGKRAGGWGFLSGRPQPRRGVAQPGRAPGSGPGGRRFKSSLPDQSYLVCPEETLLFDTESVREGHPVSIWGRGRFAQSPGAGG